MTAARHGVAALVLAFLLLVWLVTAGLTTGECPEGFSAGFGNVFLAITAVCALVTGLVGGGVRTRHRIVRSLAAGGALAAWSIVLLARTQYLEPLPGSAGTLAAWLLVVAALGAGLVAGLQWWAIVALPAGAVGLFHLSDSLLDDGVECGPFHPSVARGMLLIPVALAAGMVLARFVPRSARIAGVVVLLAPLAGVGWAGLRHANPVDRQPAEVYPIELRALPELPSYRGLAIGDSKARMLAVLGRPDRAEQYGGGRDSFVDYTYGDDTVTWARSVLTGAIVRHDLVYGIVVRDPRAQTAQGVGIGDNLELFRRRYSGFPCFVPLHDWNPICDTESTYTGASGYAYVVFEDDPIETIRFEGLPTTP